MNLYEKLSAENKAKIEEIKKERPSTYEGIIEGLRKSYWVELTVLEASVLCTELTGKSICITELNSMFNS